MRIVILRSRRASGRGAEGPYTQEFTSPFADKVIGNLTAEAGFCGSCGPDCTACRKGYDRRFGGSIAAELSFPGVLPYLMESPAGHVPHELPPHDIILAINIHEQVLVEVLKRCGRWGTRGVVVPVEAPDWLSGSARSEVREICDQGGVEVAFPKPFCAFGPPEGTALADFRRRFHIGKPEVRLTVRGNRVQAAHVEVSAACGATYYVARWLEGRSLDEDLKHEVIAKRMHSYPCTASMKWDDEIGDTPMHVASQAHYEILAPLTGRGEHEPAMVISPVGRMVLKPVPASENIRNIEKAKEAILEALATGRRIVVSGAPASAADEEVSLDDIRSARKITPAAMSSAALILKQEGRIRIAGGRIVKVRTGSRPEYGERL